MNALLRGNALLPFSSSLLLILYSCVKDKFYRLCKDCDQVFHKSTNKRRHIRLPLVQVCTLQTECHYDQQNLPKEIKCFNWNDILTSMQDHRFIVDYCIQIHERFVKNDFLYWRETTSCLILKSIKGLIDDRKVISHTKGMPLFNLLFL